MSASSALQKLTAPPAISRDVAVRIAEQLAATQHLISSLEYLASPQDRQRGGLNNWEVSKFNFPVRLLCVRRLLDMVASPRGTVSVHYLRVIMAASLMVPGTAPWRRLVADAVLAGTSLLMYPRHHYGTDGSDQMAFLVQSLATLARLANKQPRIIDACLWTIALQTTMSYAVSGYVKLTSRTWRQGRALLGIMRTHTYGDPKIYKVLSTYPLMTRLGGILVLAMECAFPLVFLRGGRFAPIILTVAGGFHLINARVMGLGRFVWSFVAGYPAVLYVAQPKPGKNIYEPTV